MAQKNARSFNIRAAEWPFSQGGGASCCCHFAVFLYKIRPFRPHFAVIPIRAEWAFPGAVPRRRGRRSGLWRPVFRGLSPRAEVKCLSRPEGTGILQCFGQGRPFTVMSYGSGEIQYESGVPALCAGG